MTEPVQAWLGEAEVSRLQRGYYADPPYTRFLELADRLSRSNPRLHRETTGRSVEVHVIPRRSPGCVLAGMSRAVELVKKCAGYWQGDQFVPARGLEVFALPDGAYCSSGESSLDTTPVMVLRGTYENFAHLKTPLLGTLARASRIATNAYELFRAAQGKPVLTFCARYDLHEVQELDGYAYQVGARAARSHGGFSGDIFVSTQANSALSGLETEGTLSHEAIACFGGDLSALMTAYAEAMPISRLRIALLDFNNDCISALRGVVSSLLPRAIAARRANDQDGLRRYRLDGVRLDTSRELIDVSLTGLEYAGVVPELVDAVKSYLTNAHLAFSFNGLDEEEFAKSWLESVQIIVSGGFDVDRILFMERQTNGVDAYGVGSALLSSGGGSTTDFSAGVVAVRDGGGNWEALSKAGRRANWDQRLIKLI